MKQFRSLNRALRRGSLKIETRQLLGQIIPVVMRRSSRSRTNKPHHRRVKWVEYKF